MNNSNAQQGQQLSLFDNGTTLTELAVEGLTDPEIRGAAKDLLVLVRYHAAKAVQP